MKNEAVFPIHPYASIALKERHGITKRELFAAMAMQGSLVGGPGSHLRPENLAQESVQHADALIKALNNESDQG